MHLPTRNLSSPLLPSLFQRPCRRLAEIAAFVAAAVVTLAAAVRPVAAQQLIQGFETGFDLAANTRGDAALVGADFFDPATLPPQGASQLLLTTLSAGADGSSYSGTSAVSVASVEAFLNLQRGQILSGGALGDASALRLTPIALNVGDVVRFSYNFLTSATGVADGRDFAFLTLQRGSADPLLLPFASVGDAVTASSSARFDFETGTRTGQLPVITLAGTYTVGFGVTDFGNNAVGSGLLLDNVQVIAIPEPSAAILLLGLAGTWYLAATARGLLRRRTQV